MKRAFKESAGLGGGAAIVESVVRSSEASDVPLARDDSQP